MEIELRHLRAFQAVIDSGTFTTAAERLTITQPALTRTIQQLEAAVGTRLIDRSSRSLAPTIEGAVLVEKVRVLLVDLDSAIAEAKGANIVRLGFSWLLPDPWAHDTITAFETRTGAEVALSRYDDPISALTDGEVDLAVIHGETNAFGATVNHLFAETRIGAVSARSTLAGRETLTWSELSTLPLVVNTLTGTTHANSWNDPPGDREIFTCKNFDEWLELIAANRGIGAVPEAARRRAQHHNVRYIDIVDAPPTQVNLVYFENRMTPLLRSLRDCAIDRAKEISNEK